MQRTSLGLVAIIAIPGLFFGLIFSMLLLLAPAKPAAATCGPAVSVVIDGDTKVEGYTEEQLKNAAAIMGAGKALDLSVKGQMISVMVSLGESGLRVLDYRRRAGPGLPGVVPAARQRRVGLLRRPHGPHHERHELHQGPAEGRAGWELLEPTIAGNKVQRNADPYHYQKYWPEAVKLVQALSNSKFSLQGSDCAIPGQSGAGDDYPWKNSPTWLQVGANTASTSPLGMYYRECVDFALWRVNQQMGSTSAPFKFLNGTFRPDGQGLGSALTWKAGWDAKGWATGSTPRVGAVVWYAPGAGGADPNFGHVAVVKEVKDNGTYVEEGYNGNPAPADHSYYTRTVANTVPSAFLYLPTQEEKK